MRLHLGCQRGLSEVSFHHRRASLPRDGEILIILADETTIFSRVDGSVSGDAVEAAKVGARPSFGLATTMSTVGREPAVLVSPGATAQWQASADLHRQARP